VEARIGVEPLGPFREALGVGSVGDDLAVLIEIAGVEDALGDRALADRAVRAGNAAGEFERPNARLKSLCCSSEIFASRIASTPYFAIAASTVRTSPASGGDVRSAPTSSAANSGWSGLTCIGAAFELVRSENS